MDITNLARAMRAPAKRACEAHRPGAAEEARP